MGWKNLFKPKTLKAEPDPRLRWFGKLPTYADYYSSQTDADWAVEFNDWILKGYELHLARQRESGGETRLPSAACMLRLPKSHMTVLGSLQDYGGDMRGRPFPLSFYVGVPTARWPGPTSDQTLAALRVLRDLTQLRDLVRRFSNDPGRFEDVFGGREIDLTGIDGETSDESWFQQAQSLALADWFGAARSCLNVEDVDAWFQLVSTWGENIAELESEEFEPTLRFPLVMEIPFEIQVTGWLHWLEQRMDLKRRFVSLLFSHDPGGATGRLSVVAREIVPEDFLLLTAQAGNLSYVDDLCALNPAAGGEQRGNTRDASGPPPVPAPNRWADFVDSAQEA
ncbi:MAG: DUF2094 domain-containing protein [Phycisphaerae bacterium]|nr:DUF2094 domain-containing protein [Phycisphaerae bacterium]